VIVDGLLAFLVQDAFVTLLNRLIDHFPSGLRLAQEILVTREPEVAAYHPGSG
jgi:hypothetical protein